jgi:hypothetical protein
METPSSGDNIDRLEHAVREWNGQINAASENLTARLEEMRSGLDAILEAQEAAAANAEETGVIIADLEAAQKRIEQLEAEKTALSEQLAETRAGTAEKENDLTALKQQVQELQDQNAVLAAEKHDAEKLRELLEQALANCDAAHDEIERLKAELERREEDAAGPVRDVDLSRVATADDKGRKRRLGDILCEAGIISREQLDQLLSEQSGSGRRRRLGELVVERGLSTEEVIARVLAAQLGFDYLDLKSRDVDPIAAMMINANLARHHACMPLRMEGDQLVVALSNPLDLIAVDDIELASSHPVQPVVATPGAIQRAIDHFYN